MKLDARARLHTSWKPIKWCWAFLILFLLLVVYSFIYSTVWYASIYFSVAIAIAAAAAAIYSLIFFSFYFLMAWNGCVLFFRKMKYAYSIFCEPNNCRVGSWMVSLPLLFVQINSCSYFVWSSEYTNKCIFITILMIVFSSWCSLVL